jgi:hypothetical protein
MRYLIRGLGHPSLVRSYVVPELACDLDWVHAGWLPPCSFIAGAMDRTVVDTAKRNGELVAGPSTESSRLHVPKMMRV